MTGGALLLATAVALATNALPRGAKLVHDSCRTPDGKYVLLAHSIGRSWLPVTQLDRGWVHDGALSVFDGATGAYVATVLLDDPELGAPEPWGVAADGRTIAVTHFAASEISLIDRAAFERRLAERAQSDLSLDLTFMAGIRTRVKTAKRGPRGVKLVGGRAVVTDYLQDDPGVTEGELLWHDARLCFQQWQSCGSCHPQAGADGMSWNFPAAGVGHPEPTREVRASKKPPAELARCIANGFAEDLLSAPNPEAAKKMTEYVEGFRRPLSPPLWKVRDAKLLAAALARMERGETFDWVVVGSSTGKYGFDWDACGAKGLNLSCAPQGMDSNFLLLRRFRPAFRPGARVVLALCPFNSVLTHYRDPDQYFKYYGVLPPGEIRFWTPQRACGWARWLERIGGVEKLPDDPDLLLDAPPSAERMRKSAEGFMAGWKREFAFDDFDAPLTAANRAAFDQMTKHLAEMLDWCRAEGLEPVLVIPPCSKHYAKMWTPTFTKTYVLDWVRAADPRGETPLFNFLDDPAFLDDALYANSLMLNVRGRRLFTAALIEKVSRTSASRATSPDSNATHLDGNQ